MSIGKYSPHTQFHATHMNALIRAHECLHYMERFTPHKFLMHFHSDKRLLDVYPSFRVRHPVKCSWKIRSTHQDRFTQAQRHEEAGLAQPDGEANHVTSRRRVRAREMVLKWQRERKYRFAAHSAQIHFSTRAIKVVAEIQKL